ncbi:MAG: trypsin-like peptidase domain-containing protein [Deltaproteobacteria bacterium]
MFRVWGPGIGHWFSSAAFVLTVCVLSTCQERRVENAPEAEPRPSASLPEPSVPEPSVPEPAPAPAAPAPALVPVPAPPPAVVPLTPGAKTEDERNSISVFEAVAPATVFVTNKRTLVDPFRRAVEVPTGTGSGFLWDNKGHVVTNHHVVQGAQALSVTLYDHRTFDAKVVGSDPRKDIAVLELLDAPSNLHPIRVEKGLALAVGQKTLAIGNPFGLDQTLTTGIVSALGRSVPGDHGVTIRDMVQTDAAINPGNSGGPLLDSSGRLIGMNTMIFSRTGASAGIGFAVPVSSILRVVPQILKGGKSDQIGIGVVIDPDQIVERKYRIRGVLVLRVAEDGPAAKAGLRGTTIARGGVSFGDVIVGIDAEPVSDYDDLYTILDRHQPGDQVKLSVVRGDQRLQIPIQLVLLP